MFFSLLMTFPRYWGWLSFLPLCLRGVYMDVYCFLFLWLMWVNGLVILCCFFVVVRICSYHGDVWIM
jgi:hypothetical protein